MFSTLKVYRNSTSDNNYGNDNNVDDIDNQITYIDTSIDTYIDDDDISCNMFANTQILKVRKFLEDENNLDKVINFYKKNTGLLDKFLFLINKTYNQNNHIQGINLPYDIFSKYYDDLENISFIRRIKYSIEPNVKKENNNTIIKINLLELYEARQEELGIDIFNIYDTRKYFPLQKENLCYMTNFAKLNVIKWLIEIGFYNL